MTTAIKIKSIHFQFPGSKEKQLNGVTLEIQKYQITCFVGKLGSGKSILLKHINGIYKPIKGSVTIFRKDRKNLVVSEKNEILYREVGILFENPEHQIFYPIVADDIAFGVRNLGLSKGDVQNRVIQAAKRVGISHLLSRETVSLSLGEKTLVALAGILAMNPPILLLDSPGLGLDLWTKPKIIELLKELSQHHTIVIATNDVDFLEIADRLFLISDGKVAGKYKSYKNFKNALTKRKDEHRVEKEEK